jgi:hypothetical protein
MFVCPPVAALAAWANSFLLRWSEPLAPTRTGGPRGPQTLFDRLWITGDSSPGYGPLFAPYPYTPPPLESSAGFVAVIVRDEGFTSVDAIRRHG